jgi:4-hydroxy-2-oxoheptanedioate aldolase
MIETKEAVENLDAILATPGLDGVYIGPADLSQSYGNKPGVDHTDPGMVGIIDGIKDAARARGLVAGIHVASPDYARKVIEKGFQFIAIQSDARLLAMAAKQVVDQVKGAGTAPGKAAVGPY